MIHKHNHSTLLGHKARSVYYPPTGTGRDTYIMTDNGGTNLNYTPQGVPQLGNYMKFGATTKPYKPCSYTRFQKYVSDGSGRDKYVVYFYWYVGLVMVDSITKKMSATWSWESLEIAWEGIGEERPQAMDGKWPRSKPEIGPCRSTRDLILYAYLLPRGKRANMSRSLKFADRPFTESDLY